jgi:hypothetical protein
MNLQKIPSFEGRGLVLPLAGLGIVLRWAVDLNSQSVKGF